ncbi:MAG: hypothetical protein M0Q41_01070 [Bacteroidales bacterium]|nr:hypothetical protein [Acholeplasmataceae bacterium]MCK9447545.1 hypothetical protein [Bacteroidales bacterium]
MKNGFVILVTAITVTLFLTVGCEKNKIEKVGSEGLTLWWNHEVFNEQGRGYIFSFSDVERFENLYELKFEFQIDNNQKRIEVSLVDIINKGKCPVFPMPTPEPVSGCVSNGSIYIPENLLNEGTYKFIVKTASFTVQSEMIFSKETAILNIPNNDYFSSSVKETHILPKNLVHGVVVVRGEQNISFAMDFIDDLRALGLKDTINYHIYFENVDETGKPIMTSWPPDYYSIPYLLTMTSDFFTIFEVGKKHFDKGHFNWITLTSTNGDQARLNINGDNYIP